MAYKLFLIFFKLGFFSFGGGYTMIPLAQQEMLRYGIVLSGDVLGNLTAVAGVAPGPVGINLAIAMGYEIGGVGGILAATLGVLLPSIIIVLIVSALFYKLYHSKYFKSAMNGLKPVVVGITLYAAASMAIKNQMIIMNGTSIYINFIQTGICLAGFILLLKTKIHPLFLIVAGGGLGLLLTGLNIK